MMQARAGMIQIAGGKLSIAATVAARYSAVRRQGFKDDQAGATFRGEENKIIDYQVQLVRGARATCASYGLFSLSLSLSLSLSNTHTHTHTFISYTHSLSIYKYQISAHAGRRLLLSCPGHRRHAHLLQYRVLKQVALVYATKFTGQWINNRLEGCVRAFDFVVLCAVVSVPFDWPDVMWQKEPFFRQSPLLSCALVLTPTTAMCLARTSCLTTLWRSTRARRG
jgi:hypothetical protein